MIQHNQTFEEYKRIEMMNASTIVHGLRSMKRLKRMIESGATEETNEMRLGSGVHVLLLEPEEFEERFVVMPDFHLDERNVTKQGIRSQSRATEFYKSAVNNFMLDAGDKCVIERSQYDKALHCIEAIRSRNHIDEVIRKCHTEVTLTGAIEGVAFKGRVDLLRMEDPLIGDIKTTTDIHRRKFGRQFANLNIDVRMAIYRELFEQNTGLKPAMRLITQETSGDFDTALVPVPDFVLDAAMERIKGVICEYKVCSERDVWPGVDGGMDYYELDTYCLQIDDEDVDWSDVQVGETESKW